WGAEAAYAAAGLGPERIEKLVTVGIPPRAAIPWSPKLAYAARHFLSLRMPGAVSRFLANDLAQVEVFWKRWSPSWGYSAGELARAKDCLRPPGCAAAALGYYRAAMVRTPDFLRSRIAVPSLAVCGADDPALSPADFENARPCYAGEYEVVTVR